ncbi:MAG TPA: hypothetical protein ENG92_03550, partial [Thiolapillus brandeum]|nr:hypothetical protein [Thiolapillus brandeum]
MKSILLVLMSVMGVASVQAASPIQRMQQLVDYVGVDYPDAVKDGVVANPVEYAEMVDFANTIQVLANGLPAAKEKQKIIEAAEELKNLVDGKNTPNQISAVTGNLRQLLIDTYD